MSDHSTIRPLNNYVAATVMYLESVPRSLGTLFHTLSCHLAARVPNARYVFQAVGPPDDRPWHSLREMIVVEQGYSRYEAKLGSFALLETKGVFGAVTNDAGWFALEAWTKNSEWWTDRYDWYMFWNPFSDSGLQSIGHCLTILLRASMLDDLPAYEMYRFIEQMWLAVDREASIIGGVVDLAPADEFSSGLYYGVTGRSANWHRSLERELCEQQRLQLPLRHRGIYWGNFLAPQVVTKLGGIRVLDQEFNALFKRRRGGPFHMVTPLSNGGAFVRLAPTLKEIWPSVDTTGEQNFQDLAAKGAWLHMRLRDAGALM